MQFDIFFCYKDIGNIAFFTMATLLMPLLENAFLALYNKKKATFFKSLPNNHF